jgi:hypothetical protein
MLSIIISSYQSYYFSVLEKNIEETCGIEYEIIKITNPNLMGICKAYNIGGVKAKYDNLLFLHEDVIFHTQNWGNTLVKYFENQKYGVVGIAGSDYVPYVPSGWFVDSNVSKLHLIQSNKKGRVEVFNKRNFGDNKQYENVYSLDGVFMACRKKVFENFKFNESLNKFHAYDTDFSLRVASKYWNIVTGEILIEHFSEGNADEIWFKETIKARGFYKTPKGQINNKKIEFSKFNGFVEQMKKFNFSKRQRFLLIVKYYSIRKVGIKNTLKILYLNIK